MADILSLRISKIQSTKLTASQCAGQEKEELVRSAYVKAEALVKRCLNNNHKMWNSMARWSQMSAPARAHTQWRGHPRSAAHPSQTPLLVVSQIMPHANANQRYQDCACIPCADKAEHLDACNGLAHCRESYVMQTTCNLPELKDGMAIYLPAF